MNIEQILAKEFSLRDEQIRNTLQLIDEGNTIPFIARYRKEVTGNLSDSVLRELEVRLLYLRNLEQRKEDVLRLIDELGELTPKIQSAIEAAETLQAVEDIYRPYRPKKKTRATVARARGLEPLARHLGSLKTDPMPLVYAEEFVDPEKEVETVEDALQGAMDILAEELSDDALTRNFVRNQYNAHASMRSVAHEEDEKGTYAIYQDFEEKISELKPHRILALFRGEREKKLKLSFDMDHEELVEDLIFQRIRDEDHPSYPYLAEAITDGYRRLLQPSIENEIRASLKEMADQESIKVFSENLKPYLMQPPLHERVIMGIDPGYRTGCKVAIINEIGKVLAHGTVYPTKPHEKIKETKAALKRQIEKYNVSIISIGNGTASRETEKVIAELIEEMQPREIFYAMTSESGASIYSASKLADEEFPHLDVTIRGAISIARRLQDPLAELVKIEPRHIGVGQYQHDVNQKELNESLEKVVEDCVNRVGVDVNRASERLLSYVAGISKSLARNIVEHKEETGAFDSREALKAVKGMGPKSFEQSAGFLRVPESAEVLDNTGVHPESYSVARHLLGRDLQALKIQQLAKELEVGELTLQDIVEELKKPGRDPREEMPKPILRSDVLSIDDLEVGMEMMGTVRNVVDFGAFVDIGIKNDGLVHVSEISDRFVKHPSDVLTVADIVKVRILAIDEKRQKVSLTMKGLS